MNEENKKFWSFQRVQPVPVPEVAGSVENEIDAFIRDRLDKAGLKPSGPASPAELVRRMFYNVTGLPPEPDEAVRWSKQLDDGNGGIRQSAVRDLTDHLLDSPHGARSDQ